MNILLWVLLSLGSASAAECEFPVVDSVYANMTTIIINGDVYLVKGAYARSAFVAKLHACEMPQAARAFRGWRANRRATNWTGGLGLAILWPVIIATPVTAMLAGVKKSDLVWAIQEGR